MRKAEAAENSVKINGGSNKTQFLCQILNYYFLFKGNVPAVRCENGCCEDSPCLNGGTCHETCDIMGKRFTCECGPYATGNLCETGTALDLSFLLFSFFANLSECYLKIRSQS